MLISKYCLIVIGLIFSLNSKVIAAEFNVNGQINRVSYNSNKVGACMIRITTEIGNGCPNNGWVSLDCKDIHFSEGDGLRKYKTALIGFETRSTVVVGIDNSKFNDGFCVATRIDLVRPTQSENL